MRILFLLFALLALHPVQAQTFLTKAQAVNDLDTLVKVTEEVHYNPYHFISKTDFLQKTDSLKKSLPDSIEVKQFLEKLFSLTAFLEDGHTAPALGQRVFASEIKEKLFLPFSYLGNEKEGVYILMSGNAAVPKGVQLVSVNGVPVKEAKKKAVRYIGGLPSWKNEFSNRLFSYFLYLQGIRPPFSLVYEDAHQNRKKVTVQEGVDFTTVLSLSIPGIKEPPYTYSVQIDKLGYINFVSMSGSYDNFFRFLDSAFNDMRQRKIQHLAVDLRHNTGGNSNFGEILLAYITAEKFALSGKKKWRVSRRYKDYVLASGDSSSTYLSKKEGGIWEIGNCGPRARKVTKDSVYTGKVYFITGPFTFSSANMLADAVKQFRLATLIGEPTGESTNDFGEVYSFTLPNSKLRINTTTAFDVGADCNEKHNNPVVPDALIKHTVKQVLAGRDPVLEYVRQESNGNAKR